MNGSFFIYAQIERLIRYQPRSQTRTASSSQSSRFEGTLETRMKCPSLRQSFKARGRPESVSHSNTWPMIELFIFLFDPVAGPERARIPRQRFEFLQPFHVVSLARAVPWRRRHMKSNLENLGINYNLHLLLIRVNMHG